MSHLICCERVSGGRAFFFPEDVGAFLEGSKDGKSGVTLLLRNNNAVQIKDSATTLLAKMMQAKGGGTILTIYKADPGVLGVLPPIEDAPKEVEDETV